MKGPIGCAYPSYSISMWSLRVQNHGQHPFTNGTNSTYNYIGNQPFTPIAYILALHHHTYIIIFPLVYTVYRGYIYKGSRLVFGITFFSVCFFWICCSVRFPCNLQNFGAGSCHFNGIGNILEFEPLFP